jgi:AcrR family transcriptional regulator
VRVSAIERREQLISATVGLMQREGIQSITLRAIAKEADAPLATVHYCFRDKDELMDAAAEHWLQRMSSYSSDVPAGLGLRKTVEYVAEGYWGSLVEDPAGILAQIELVTWAIRNSATSDLRLRIYPAYEKELGNLFAAAATSQPGDHKIDGHALARRFLAVFDGASLQYIADAESSEHRRNFFSTIDALLTGTGF